MDITSILGLIPVIGKVIWHPKIKLEAVNDNECIQSSPRYETGVRTLLGGSIDVSPAMHRVDSNWLSLRIKNVGNSKATGVYCKLIEMRNQKTGEIIGPFNPAPLNWTVYPSGTSKIQLAKGEPHLVNLVSQQEGEEYVRPTTVNIPNSLFEQLKDKLSAGEYTFKVTVYGDNIDSASYPVEIIVGKNYKDLKFLKEIK